MSKTKLVARLLLLYSVLTLLLSSLTLGWLLEKWLISGLRFLVLLALSTETIERLPSGSGITNSLVLTSLVSSLNTSGRPALVCS